MSQVRGTVSQSPSATCVDFEWRIDNFLSLFDGIAPDYSSPRFFYGGQTWVFVIYPSGRNHLEGYLDLSLFRISGGAVTMLEFSFWLKTAKGEKDHEEHCIKLFGGLYNHVFYEFLLKSEVLRRQSEFIPSGTLTVVCSMKRVASPEDIILLWKEESKEKKRKVEEKDDVESLSRDYKKVLLDGSSHDLILKVGNRELKAHRDILKARSRVFESMLSHDMAEKNSGVIDIRDCDPTAMEQFLSYVYCGKVEKLDHSNMFKLYYAADKYEMQGLKRECQIFIEKSLCPSKVCEAIQLALNHSDSSLLEKATEYFMDNALDIFQTMEWQSFMKGNTMVANELLIKSFKKKEIKGFKK